MAKQIYNFEVFIHKKEELLRIRRGRLRRRRAKIAFFIGVIILILVVLYALHNSRFRYYVYKQEKETVNSNDVTYQPFAGGYIKYSSDGVEYQRHFDRAVWNVPVSCRHPYGVQSSSYFVLADKGSNELTIFDVNGKVSTLTLKYPVMQTGVSDKGIVEVILDGGSSSYIQMYDKTGNMIADMKASVDETGYPVTAAVSPDGSRLAVSFFSIAGISCNTRVAIYDFSQQLQGNEGSLAAGFDHEDLMIPKLTFTDDRTLAAFGEDKTFFYSVTDTPKLKRTIEFRETIESVFEGKNCIGYVLDNNTGDPAEGRYRLRLYSKTGTKKIDVPVDMNYETIRMIGHEIFAVRENECTIINSQGKIIFQETLNGNGIASILPALGFREYHVVFRDRIVHMSLRFWGED